MKVVIIGGVAGGAGAAARLRRNDEFAEIVLLEKDEYISFANCGLPYYIGGVIKHKDALTLQTPESFNARFNVDVRVKNEVLSINTAAKELTVLNHVSGEKYTESYDKLVVSPGASPIKPPLAGTDLPHVFTLRNIPDTFAITEYIKANQPKTAAVIGAGFIGLEMAENLAENGIKVSVVDASDHVMPPIDKDMSHDVHNYIRSKGISLYLGCGFEEITETSVKTSNGNDIPADIVIMSIGVRPATAFLKNSGINLGERGEILVNEYLETSAPDVFALGDAATVVNIVTGGTTLIPLAGPANKQARIVADNVCGRNLPYKGSQGTSIMKFFDLSVATTGVNERELIAQNIPFEKTFTYSASHADYYPGADMMFIKTLFHTDTHKILGAQIVGGKGVDSRIDSLANAVRFGMDIYDLQEMELAYAPPFSSAKDPVNIAGYVAENIIEGRTHSFYPQDIGDIPEDAVKLDIRVPEAYNYGHIPGFRNLPLCELRNAAKDLDPEKPVYLYCQIGQTGYIAERLLNQRGIKNTFNLAGGYRYYTAFMSDK